MITITMKINIIVIAISFDVTLLMILKKRFLGTTPELGKPSLLLTYSW